MTVYVPATCKYLQLDLECVACEYRHVVIISSHLRGVPMRIQSKLS